MLLIFLFRLVNSDHWDYGHTEWGGVCDSGIGQSPININTATTDRIYLPPLEFHDYDVRGSISDLNNGHTELVQGFTSWTKQPSISGGGLGARYVLNQFHFHWDVQREGSEHTIDGKSFPLELHFVHIREDLNETTAGSVPAGMAVVAVRFEQSWYGKALFELGAALAGNKYFNNTQSSSWYSPQSLLPRDTSSYYRYNGSLTTPPCSEVVVWSILEEPNYVTEHQLNTMRSYFSNDENLIIKNHRPVQPLNGRTVYKVDSNVHNNAFQIIKNLFNFKF